MDVMHSEQEFTIKLAGSTFRVVIDDGRRAQSQGHLRIQCTDDGFIVCEQFGHCNPFVTFWKSHRATLSGAAREAALIKIVRETVAHEIDNVFSFVRECISADEPIGLEVAGFLGGFSARAARAAA
jgi:hypothetical protein